MVASGLSGRMCNASMSFGRSLSDTTINHGADGSVNEYRCFVTSRGEISMAGNQEKHRLVFSSRRYLSLFFALVIIGVSGLACVYASYDIYLHYGLAPGDGGVLRPYNERAAFALVILTLGFSCLAATAVYAHRYVLRIERFGRKEIRLTTLSWHGVRRLTVFRDRLSMGNLHRGKSRHVRHDGAMLRVDAPYRLLRIEGRRIPFVVDMKGKIHDKRSFTDLL